MIENQREQILNVLFASGAEELDEGLGTAIKHGAQNVGNAVQNAFAITAKQKAQAANRTATLKATQDAENKGNQQLKNVKKAGKKAYKDIMAKWTIKDANAAMDAALKANDIDTLIQGLEYAICGINVLGAGKVNGQQEGGQPSDNVNQARQNAVQQAKDDIQADVNAAQNVSGNPENAEGGNQ